MRPVTLIRIGVLALLAAGAAAHFHFGKAHRDFAQALVEAERQNQAGGQALRAANRLWAEADLQQVAPSPSLSAAKAPTPSSPPLPPPLQRQRASELAADKPALDAFRVQSDVARIRRPLLAFFRLHGFTPEQVRRYEELHGQYLGRLYDLMAVAQKQDPAGREAIMALRQKNREDLEVAMRELLGEDGEAALREFNRTQRVRDTLVYGLAGIATLEGVPLTQQQGDQLFDAALRSSRAAPDATAMDILKAVDWTAYRAEARRILSPEQFGLMESRSVSTGYGSFTSEELAAAVARAVATDTATQHAQP